MRFWNKKVEGCFDYSTIYEYRLEKPITVTLIQVLGGRLGSLQYFADLPRPFFRIQGQGGTQIRGIQGERDFQAVFPSSGRPERKGALEAVLRELQP